MSACPSPSDLEAFARGEPAGASAAEHVHGCATCKRVVDEILDNLNFIRACAEQLPGAFDAALDHAAEGAGPRAGACGSVPGFELLEEITRGGQGVVFRAHQTDSKRPAAVKMLLGGTFASSAQLRRFEREIEIAARLRHPYIVSVFDSGLSSDGLRYVAMEYVSGAAIDHYVRCRWPLGSRERNRTSGILGLVQLVAEGVGYAHANGVMHRDLKPSNILVDAEGKPRVLDFGLARPSDDLGGADVTQGFAGTPAYSAPEQFSSTLGPVSTRTDVYALGIVLYNLLTERHPYPSDGLIADASRHAISTEPVPPSRYVARLPEDVEAIVLKAIAKEPSRRYQTAADLASDIENHLAGRPVSARRGGTLYVLRTLARKHRAATLVISVMLGTILVASIGLALLANDIEHARRATQAALSESTLQRARLMAALGDTERAESILWSHALEAGMTTGEDAFFRGSPATIRSAWSLAELYSRLPRRFRGSLDALPNAVGFDASGQSVWAIDAKGNRFRYALDGRMNSRQSLTHGYAPQALGTRASDNGRWVAADTGAGFLFGDPDQGPLKPSPADWDPSFHPSAISDDGRYIACCRMYGDGAIRIFDARSATTIAEFADNAYGTHFQTTSAGAVLLVATREGPNSHVLVRHSPDWQVAQSFPMPPPVPGAPRNSVRNPRLSPDGGWLVATWEENIVRWSQVPGRTAGDITWSASSPIDASEIDDSGNFQIIGTHDGTITVLQFQEASPLLSIPNGAAVLAIATGSAANVCAVGDQANHVSVYEIENRAWLERLPASSLTKQALSVSIDGTLAWGDDQGELTIRGPRSFPPPITVRAHASEIASVDFSPDGREILTAGFDGAIHVWNLEGRRTRTVAAGIGRLCTARFSPDATLVASGHRDGTARLWKLGTDDPPRILDCKADRVPTLSFSPDGRFLACAASVGYVNVWDVVSGHRIHQLGEPRQIVRAVTVSPDSRTIITGGDDQTITAWDAATGRKLRSVEGLPWDVFDLKFAPSGVVLFAIGRGGEVVAINSLEGTELAKLSVHQKLVFSLAISPDGRRLYTAGQDPWIGVIDFDHLLSYIRGNEEVWRRELSTNAAGTP